MNKVNFLKEKVYIYAIIWLISYCGCLGAIKTFSLPKPLGIFLVIIPIITFVIFAYKYYSSFKYMDEVEIKIEMEAVVIAFVLGFITLMKLGLFDLVITLNKEDWSYRHLLPIFAVYYFIGLFITKRKYNFEQ